MSKIHGKMGAVYYRKATVNGTDIAFVDSNPDTITRVAADFVTAGFETGDYITVSGAAQGGNNDTFLIANVAAGTLTLDAGDALTAESAGATVTISEALPGTALIGFYDFSVDDGVMLHDVTCFEDNGYRKRFAGLYDWSGTANRFYVTDAGQMMVDWVGDEVLVRFFNRYAATPAGGDKAQWYEGLARVEGIVNTEEVGEMVRQTITFAGNGQLSRVNRTTAWPT